MLDCKSTVVSSLGTDYIKSYILISRCRASVMEHFWSRLSWIRVYKMSGDVLIETGEVLGYLNGDNVIIEPSKLLNQVSENCMSPRISFLPKPGMGIMASCPITSWQIDGKQWKQFRLYLGGAPKSLQMVAAAIKLKNTYSLEEKLWPT